MAAKRSSISDVAVLAGTSGATVSKVLSGRADARISPETAERVRAAARQLHYAPWLPAQSLRQRRTQTIGVITSDIGPHMGKIIEGVNEAALSDGLSTVLAIHRNDTAVEASHLRMALRGQVDGLIIAPAHDNQNQRIYDELKEGGIPFVFVDRYIPGYDADYVGTRNDDAAYRLTWSLIERGADVIGCIRGRGENSALAERFAGFRRAIAEAGLPLAEDLTDAGPSAQRVQAIERMLARRPCPNGLFWASYSYIQPALSVFASHGVVVPNDVRFAGFDEIALSLARAEDYQSLRVIRGPWPVAIQPTQEIGRRTLQILQRSLESKDERQADRAPQHVLLEPQYLWLDGRDAAGSDGSPESPR